MNEKTSWIAIGITLIILSSYSSYLYGKISTQQTTLMHQMGDGSMMAGKDMGTAMQGMMMGLEGKSGVDLEKAFLDEMIVHHEGAIGMAQALLRGTQRPELLKLGNDIITAQTGEIVQMKQWRTEWFK